MSLTDSISEYYTAERPELLGFVSPHGPFTSVLDIGCAGGLLGASLLKSGIAARCDGIEPNSQAACLAAQQLQHVWHGGLEAVADQVPWEEYDLIAMADVLEHLVDPWSALRDLHARTQPSVRLLLSVPNVRHYKISLPLLLRGDFRYVDHGIMDRTHLHFFTRDSLNETLNECGWQAEVVGSHMKSRYRRWYMPTHLIEPFVAVQYMVLGRKR